LIATVVIQLLVDTIEALKDFCLSILQALENSGQPAIEITARGSSMKTMKPPFDEETARLKVKAAEDAWNSRDPERVALAYTEDCEWRNRTEFFKGREAIKEFLRRKWAKELDYRLMKELWAYTGNRISVRFEYEWRDENQQWYRTHGNEHWEFDENGLMCRRDMSANDYPIIESERRIK
jgi:nuclear transport factor 2 (NTF2) superfamily protein